MSDGEGVLERQLAALNAHDVDALADCFHEELRSEDHVHPSQTFTGREQVRRNWDLMFANVPDLRAELRDSAVVGDTVWAEWRIYGTRRDGGMLDLRGVIVSEVRDGRIAASRRYLMPLDASDDDIDAGFRRLVQPSA